MKLSIITINYNNKNGLQKTIDSVICQTFKDFEWIIIDGGSTDGSKELIEHYHQHFAFWCSEPDKGIYNAMNKGVSHANGEYTQFLNSGDCLHDENVLYQIFNGGIIADVIYGDMIFVSNKHVFTAHFPELLSFHYFLCNSIGHPASFIKSFLLKNSGYREDFKIVSDWYKFMELYREGKSFVHVNVIIADFDSTGVSSNILKAENEREEVLKDFLGEDNKIWVQESINRQRLYEELVALGYMSIKNLGGWKLRICHLIIKLINKI